MTDKLMPKKVIINPFISFAPPSLSAPEEFAIEILSLEDIIDRDG